MIEILLVASLYMILSIGADQSARVRMLVYAFIVHKPPKKGFLALRPIYHRSGIRISKIHLFFICFSK